MIDKELTEEGGDVTDPIDVDVIGGDSIDFGV
jgi:hypothetical protein